MAIFDEKKMEQKPVYPTKRTPSYADWALFNMGKELEESIQGGGGGEITVDQEVIAGSTNAVAGGAVKTYVDAIPNGYIFAEEKRAEFTVGAGSGINNYRVNIGSNYTDKDIFIVVKDIYDDFKIKSDSYISPINSIRFTLVNLSQETSGIFIYDIYTRNKVQTDRRVTIIGIEGNRYNKIPDSSSSDANKVLTVGSNGYPEWQTPSSGGSGITAHTFTTMADIANAIAQHPNCIVLAKYGNNIDYNIIMNVAVDDYDNAAVSLNSTIHDGGGATQMVFRQFFMSLSVEGGSSTTVTLEYQILTINSGTNPTVGNYQSIENYNISNITVYY